MSQVKIATREEIFGKASRAAAMPLSESDKLRYVETVFEYMGFDKKFIGMLSDELIDEMLKAEKFGCSTNAPNLKTQRVSAQNESGSNTRTQGDMELAILWFYYNNLYTVIAGVNWLDIPVMRSKDIISIDLGDGSIVNDSPNLLIRYTTTNGEEKEASYNYSMDEYCGTGTACAFEFNLPGGSINDGEMAATISYQMKDSTKENTISLQYFHKFIPFPVSISASYIVGISVSPASCVTEYNLQCGTA